MTFAQNFELIYMIVGGAGYAFVVLTVLVCVLVAWREDYSREGLLRQWPLMTRRLAYVGLAGLACFVAAAMVVEASETGMLLIVYLGMLEYYVCMGIVDDLVLVYNQAEWYTPALALMAMLSFTSVLSQCWLLVGWLIIGACHWLMYYDVVAGKRAKLNLPGVEKRSAFGLPYTERAILAVAVALALLLALTFLLTLCFGAIG